MIDLNRELDSEETIMFFLGLAIIISNFVLIPQTTFQFIIVIPIFILSIVGWAVMIAGMKK